MRFMGTDRRVIFFCDDCGKRLQGDDDGTPYWADYDNFMDTVGSDDEEPTLFLCKKCLTTRKDVEQS